MLPGSLICPVLIASSVFFNICLFTKHHAVSSFNSFELARLYFLNMSGSHGVADKMMKVSIKSQNPSKTYIHDGRNSL